ncbi:MAG: transposase [Planctomycetota bacterium]|nr:transposase [Planctomycetota bacterium]
MARAADPALAEWWFELIELADESWLTVAELCRQHGVSTASFYNWRRKFRDTSRERGGFVPVNITETEQRIDQPLPVRIVWPQGVIMEIPATDHELVLLVAGTLAGSEARS